VNNGTTISKNKEAISEFVFCFLLNAVEKVENTLGSSLNVKFSFSSTSSTSSHPQFRNFQSQNICGLKRLQMIQSPGKTDNVIKSSKALLAL
jgi:hypothetical protein